MATRKPPLPTHFHSPIPGVCRWCNTDVNKILKNGKPSKSSWHDKCVKEYKTIHWPSYTRRLVWNRDKGLCKGCGTRCDRKGKNGWHMDHIIPLYSAQGQIWAWGMNNLQTLCKICHKKKTSLEATHRAEIRKKQKE